MLKLKAHKEMKGVWKNFEEKILYIYEKKLLQNGTTIIVRESNKSV